MLLFQLPHALLQCAHATTVDPALARLPVLTLASPAFCRSAVPEGARRQTALQLTDIVTGWFDSGIVNGQNKLVPTISFRVKNTSTQSIGLRVVQRGLPRHQRPTRSLAPPPQKASTARGSGLPAPRLRPSWAARSSATLHQRRGSTFCSTPNSVMRRSKSSPSTAPTGWVKLGEFKVQRQADQSNPCHLPASNAGWGPR